MEFQILIFLFILGLMVGSFLNVVIYWLETNKIEQKTVKSKQKTRGNLGGRSFCPSCGHQLKFLDLIPVLSWIFLCGKCRYCGEKISLQYPLVELGTGLIFALTYYFFPFNIDLNNLLNPSFLFSLSSFLLLLIVNCLLLIIFIYDLKHKIIPDKVMLPAIVLAISYQLSAISGGPLSLFLFPLFSAFGAGSFFYALAYFSDGKWMGGGDIKLVFFMGLFLGWPNILVGLFLGFLSGALFGIALMVSKKAQIQSEIPFGPFLIFGTWIALFWGSSLIKHYLEAFIL